ncbi:MAG: 2OG-Fe(II) oxygenase [Candidatus Puniceispirillaceae bacterium]
MWVEKHDFLEPKQFQNLNKELSVLDQDLRDNVALTEVEKKKIVYRLDSMPKAVTDTIALFGSQRVKDIVAEMTGWDGEIYSLIEMPGFGGYAPYHTMKSGGFLGSHVDHSYIENEDYIHMANCIFYASPQWQDEWEGATLFFDKNGTKEIGRSLPDPNKIVVFTHDSESFHGVSRINCPPEVTRHSFYMDFYVKKADLPRFSKQFEATTGEPFVYVKYLTTFLPLPKDGNRTLMKALFKKSFIGYLRNYLFYLRQKNEVVSRLTSLQKVGVHLGCFGFTFLDKMRGIKR